MPLWTLVHVGLLGSLVLQSSPAPVDPLQPSTTPTEFITSMQDRYDRMTVPVTIEGQGPYRFMIDTGSQATVVTRALSEKLQLPQIGNATVVGMASTARVKLVALDGLEFAARVFDNIEAPQLEAYHIGADGILGLDSLQDMRVQINFREDTIAVDEARRLGGNRGFEIVVRARRKLGRLIITDAQIDGVRTDVILDTGAQWSIANLALKRKLRANRSEVASSMDVNGNLLTGTRDFARVIKIKGMRLENVPIVFTDSPAFDALELSEKPALILGMSSLRAFDRVAIDFSSREVLFDLPPSSQTNIEIRMIDKASIL